MAIHSGLHSRRVRKSIGELTYSNWKGISTVRGKATQVANPRTFAQRIQRLRMRAMAQLGSSALTLIRKGFFAQAVKKSEFNVFTSINMPKVSAQINGQITIDYPDLMFSRGERRGFGNIQAPVLNANDLSVDFTAPQAGDLDEFDLGNALVLDQDDNLVISIEDDFSKAAGTVSIPMPAYASGQTFHVYLFAQDPATGQVSGSQYAGSVTAP